MQQMMNTKEVSRFLNVNEKMVYSLIADKQLPATKVTGKWLFPRKLVEQWVENNTVNFPDNPQTLPAHDGLLILAGSNDILLDKVIGLFNQRFSGHLAVFGNVGSMGGLHALKNKLCHIAASHLLQSDDEYNFSFAHRELGNVMPVVVNFCNRRQGNGSSLAPPDNQLERCRRRLISQKVGRGQLSGRLLPDRAGRR